MAQPSPFPASTIPTDPPLPPAGSIGARFAAVVPSHEALTEEQRETAEVHGWPIAIRFQSDAELQEFLRRRDGRRDDNSNVADLLVTELVRSIGRIAERDPDLVRGLLKLAAPSVRSVGPSDTFCISTAAYAKRVGYSKRTIEAFVARGMPSVGQKRLRRIPVAEADEWLRTSMGPGDVAIESEARAVARSRRRRVA